MNLEGILTVAGKPGLHRLVAQSRGGIIVESLTDGKRMPVPATKNVSALKDIAIFTQAEELPLATVFERMLEKTGKDVDALPHQDANLRKYFGEVVPDFDQDRVYNSDIRKVVTWYKILLEKGLLEQPAGGEVAEAPAEEKPAPKPKKKAAPKKEEEE